MTLALKVLSARYRTSDDVIDLADVAVLKSYLGKDADGLAVDQIACEVIERELKKLKLSRAQNA